MLGAYVLSKNIDDVVAPDPGLTPGVNNPLNIRLDKGRGNFDRRHAFSMSWLWSPGLRFNAGWRKHMLGGWSVAGFHAIQSGAPLTLYNGSADFSGFNQFFDRPDVTGTDKLTQDNRNPDAAFDTKYFSATPPPCFLATLLWYFSAAPLLICSC